MVLERLILHWKKLTLHTIAKKESPGGLIYKCKKKPFIKEKYRRILLFLYDRETLSNK